MRRLNELRARVRPAKGVYREPSSLAFLWLARLLLDEGTYPAIATHARRLIRIHDGLIVEDRTQD